MAFVNQTIDDTVRDPTLHYQGFWFLTGTWNASHTGTSGTLASSSDVSCNVTFTFPVPARAFYYYGIPRCCGGRYQICVDCDPNNPAWQPIDAVNATDDGRNPPIVLYSHHFTGTPGVHVVILSNTPDERFGNNSQITFDKFDIEVFDSSASSSVDSSTSTTTAPAPPSTSTPLATPSPSPSPSAAPIGPIVGAVIAGVVLVGTALFVFFFLRRRRQRLARLVTPGDDGLSPPLRAAIAELPNSSSTEIRQNPLSTNNAFVTPIAQRSSIAKGGKGRVVAAPPSNSYPTTSTAPSSSVNPPSTAPSASHPTHSRGPSDGTDLGASDSATRNVSRGIREVDAGPVSMNEEEEEEMQDTLPPDYRDVFNIARSPTTPRRQ